MAVSAVSAATLLATAYAVKAPVGQPYDEPAHWSNVLFYLRWGRLPTIGEPGADYEAQMGPVYYVLSAGVAHIWPGVEPGPDLYAVRLVWVLCVPLLGWMVYRLARLSRLDSGASAFACALVVLNPLMLAMSGSVSNDYFAIVIAGASVLMCARLLINTPTLWSFLLVGAVAGAAVLTKLTAVGIVAALVIGVLVAPGNPVRRRLAQAGLIAAGALLTSGWWFVRNLMTYGDLTGGQRLLSYGYEWRPLRDVGPTRSGTRQRGRGSTFLPVEYFRNVFHATPALRAMAIALTVLCCAVVAIALTRSRPGRWSRLRQDHVRTLLVVVVAVTVVEWVAYCVVVWSVPPRLLFVAAPATAVLFSLCWKRSGLGWWVPLTVLTGFVIAAAWILWERCVCRPQPYSISGALRRLRWRSTTATTAMVSVAPATLTIDQ